MDRAYDYGSELYEHSRLWSTCHNYQECFNFLTFFIKLETSFDVWGNIKDQSYNIDMHYSLSLTDKEALDIGE